MQRASLKRFCLRELHRSVGGEHKTCFEHSFAIEPKLDFTKNSSYKIPQRIAHAIWITC
jgi:hypothetical protein